jgi:C1A family cysteine protease
LLQQFGHPATVGAEVDLRPKFFQLELNVKNQGRRPSCAVFAIVSALEFQNAQLTGATQKFSEEYLIWATRKTAARIAPASNDADPADDADEGFTLSEVVNALRAYGVPLQASMPNTFGRAMKAIEEPAPAVVQEARDHRRVFVHSIPGRDNLTRINNLVHALNAGVPVAVGMGWPYFRFIRSGYLSEQKPVPGAGHAVTLVGYKSASGRLEDTVFLFKNSWGVGWGQGGYGWVTFGYLERNLGDAALLEVQPAGT